MTRATEFRKRPIVIEAMQWRGPEDDAQVYRWLPHDKFCVSSEGHPCITTLEGTMLVERGDWIIRGIRGEYYPCKPGIFAATYEPVERGEPGKGGGEG